MLSRINRLNRREKKKKMKYFLATIVQRRQSNKILMLKGGDEESIRNPNQLNQNIENYFSYLHCSTGVSMLSAHLEEYPSQVRD